MTTHTRVCPLCEATCGLSIEVEAGVITRIEGDADDVFSKGYLCPKGVALRDLHEDPDRLRTPMVKRDGQHEPASWDEAFEAIANGLGPILEESGTQAVGIYAGNPTVHNVDLSLYVQALLRVVSTPHRFTASTLDQLPKQVSGALMFGGSLTVPIPDIDRTDYLLCLGANPLASNGSLLTAPDLRGRLRRLQKRGGTLVVVDPRRSETAKIASRHLAIRPGTDALLLAGIACTLFEEGLVDPGSAAQHARGLDTLRSRLAEFAPEQVAAGCGIGATAIRTLARELAAASSAAVYGRIGTTTTEFGTTASWLVDVVNFLTGNLDRPGGALFPLAPAFGTTDSADGHGRGIELHRHHSRVRGVPEALGEFPAACMAEEIETPGAGRIRAFLTIAGNPALSAPHAGRLERALASLDFMVSVDIYQNETTRHADVILPGLSPLEHAHFDVAFAQLAIHNTARFSAAIFPPAEGAPHEWEILLRLAGILLGQGAKADIAGLDSLVIRAQVEGAVRSKSSPLHGRDADEIVAALEPRRGSERLIDFGLRSGPYGDHFGARPEGLSLDHLVEHPHGIDLGALRPRLPGVLRMPDGKIDLAPPLLVADLDRLAESLGASPPSLVLIGRRHVRSNNSWLHNLQTLSGGRKRCTLLVHPDDAKARGLAHGGNARVESRVGRVVAPVEVTHDIMPGVVSLPHGWGHDAEGTTLSLAAQEPGINTNILTDDEALDPLSGTSVLNGIPVEISPADA
jgi:anaerobic selenocysteine-containing dehydrogenase